MCGYIKLHRQILDWGWYNDTNTFRIFMHLLLKASSTNRVYRDIKLNKGQLITSISKLAEQTGLTVKQVRNCLDKLKRTNEITIYSNRQYSTITIKKWANYQGFVEDSEQEKAEPQARQGQAKGTQGANERQTEDKPRATVKECKNEEVIKKINKKENFINSIEFEYQKPLAEWLEHHKSNFKTEKQWIYQYKKLKSFVNPAEVVEHSIGNNYKGLYAPKENPQSTFDAIKEVDCYIEQSPLANQRPPSAYLLGE